MKIYKRIVFDMQTMKIVEENSYRYKGKLILCKGGGGSSREADRAFELQQEQLRLQRKQLKELKLKEQGIEAAKQLKLDELIKRKRKGFGATILTDFGLLGEADISKKSLFSA